MKLFSHNSVSWKDYEEQVFRECRRVFYFKEVEIIKNAHIVGRYSGVKRQIDVLIKQLEDGIVVSSILIECKHYRQKIDVKIVDAFVGCMIDVGAEKGVIVSERGFTKAAISRAHNGKEDIEVDIMSLGDLQELQSQVAIPYSGENGLAIVSPFGWIIDGKHRGFAPAVLYRRGIPFEEATEIEMEWRYLQFWSKDQITLSNLIETQNECLVNIDADADIRITEVDGLTVREAYLPSYPTPEITIFREFDSFIVFLVLLCPECYVQRDTKKAVDILKAAIPLIVQHHQNIWPRGGIRGFEIGD